MQAALWQAVCPPILPRFRSKAIARSGTSPGAATARHKPRSTLRFNFDRGFVRPLASACRDMPSRYGSHVKQIILSHVRQIISEIAAATPAGLVTTQASFTGLISSRSYRPSSGTNSSYSTLNLRNQSSFLSSSAIRLFMKSRGLNGRFWLVSSAFSGSEVFAAAAPFSRSISLRRAAARSALPDVRLTFFAIVTPPSMSETHIGRPKWFSRVCTVVIPTPELNRDVSRRQMLLDKQARYRLAILVAPFQARSASLTAQSIPRLIVGGCARRADRLSTRRSRRAACGAALH
jgi:hypothetical protein